MDLFGFCAFSSVQLSLFGSLFILLHLFVLPSFQDTLFCGSSSYQITLDPSRPNVFAAGGRGSGAGGGSGSSLAMPNPGAKYQFVRMNALMRNVCELVPEQLTPDAFSSRLVITRCEECSKCPQMLADIQRTLSQLSLDADIQSLLVILIKDFESARSIARLVQDTTIKFVFLDEDDLGSPTVCELADSNDGNSLKDADSLKTFSKTSVLFVSISFIILMVISLAWLVFYYVQRFRYAHAKDRLQRRLFNAAKKALARIPTRPVKAGDKELNSDCPVCIDPYRQGDICRQLPCRHIFHKSCVDPWLLEHRTCPMCKSDILKAFGYHVNNGRRRAQFSAAAEEDGTSAEQHDMPRGHSRRLSLDANSTGSESANPFPVVTEVHDPFDFSPSASPQLIQMDQESPRGVQIVPLTVSAVQPQQPPAAFIQQASIERHGNGGTEAYDPAGIETRDSVAPPTNQSRRLESAAGTQPDSDGGASSSSAAASPAGLSLFRAVTGRRHPHQHNMVNLVHVRSRSFSQSQEAATTANHKNSFGANVDTAAGDIRTKAIMPKTNSAIYGFGTETAIVYSVDNCKKDVEAQLQPPSTMMMMNGSAGGLKQNLEMPAAVGTGGTNLARARTAPSGFRRKIVANGAAAAATTLRAAGGGHWWSQRVKTAKSQVTRETAGGGGGGK